MSTRLSRFALRMRSLLSIALSATALALVPATAESQSPPAPKAPAEFTILIYESAEVIGRRNDSRLADAYWASYDRFAAELMNAGVLRGGSAVDERVARTVRGNGSADRGVSGARLSGYFVIAAPDMASAERWARQAPPEAVAVEIRPHRANPHMTPPAGK